MSEAHSIRTGVYCWRNTVNGKVYVGSASRSFEQRRRLHVNELRAGRHRNSYLQRAWDKYKEASFLFEVVERCAPDDCVRREQHWIDALKAADRKFGYNLSPTAGSNRGVKFTDEHRANLAAAHMGHRHTTETRARMSQAHKGKVRSPAHRSEEHTSELQSLRHLVCRLLLEKKKDIQIQSETNTAEENS